MISDRDLSKGKVLVSVCGVIEGKDRSVLLMVEGDFPYHKQLVLPGGYVRPQETVPQALIREVKEETGLRVTPKRLIGLYEDFLTENNEPINHIIAAYSIEFVGGSIIFSKEATAYKWLTLNQAFELPEIPQVFKRVLRDFGKKHGRHTLLRRHPE